MSDHILRKGETLKQYEARSYKNIPGAADLLERKRGEIKAKSKTKALDKAKASKPKEKTYGGMTADWHKKDMENTMKRLGKK